MESNAWGSIHAKYYCEDTNTMPENKTVRINNRLYDAVTGLPVDNEPAKKEATTKPTKSRPQTPSAAVHTSTQRSQTLHRRATKKPGAAVSKRPKPGTHMDIARSGAVTRFAAHPQPAPAPVKKEVSDTPHTTHPVAARASAKAKKVTKAAPTPKQVKDAAIEKALKTTSTPSVKAKKASASKKRRMSWTRRRAIIASIALLILSLGIVTYFNLPSISVAWASSQAGVDATYPKYTPSGYGLGGVSYQDGEVTLGFTSNAGTGKYDIIQERSTWDSSAVRDNVVRKNAGENFIINQEQGLTIYVYDSNAAWVTGGILYQVQSDAPLSADQLRRIATSL